MTPNQRAASIIYDFPIGTPCIGLSRSLKINQERVARAIAAALTERTKAAAIEAELMFAKILRRDADANSLTGAIMRLDSPPAPPSPFGCACWREKDRGYEDTVNETTKQWFITKYPTFKFCPFCGATRRKETI